MADFNAQLSAPSTSGAQVLQPVESVNYGQALNTLAGVGKLLVDNAKAAEEQKKKDLEAAVVSEYVRNETALNNSLVTGSINPSQHGALSRASFNKFAASYSQYLPKLKEARDALKGNTELENTLALEESIKAAQKNRINGAVQAGFPISMGMDESVRTSILEAYDRGVRADADFKRMHERAQEARAAGTYQRETELADIKNNTVKTLQALGGSNVEAFQKYVADIPRRMKEPGADPVKILNELKQYHTTIEAGVTATAAQFPELGNSWRTLFKDIYSFGEDAVSNKTGNELLKRRFEEAVLKAKISAVSDPKVMGLHVTSALLGNNLPASFLETNTTALNTIMRLTQTDFLNDGAPIVINDAETAKVSVDFLKSGIDGLQKGTHADPEKAKQQVSNGINNILRQVSVADVYGGSPDKIKPVMDLVASPQFAYAVKNGLVDKDSGQRAIATFQKQYEAPLLKEVSTKLKEGITFSREQGNVTMSADRLIDVQFNGNGIEFVAKTGRTTMSALESSVQTGMIDNLKSSKMAVNQLITIGAHLAGTTDYRKYFEENKHNLLPDIYPDPKKLKEGEEVNGMVYMGGNYRNQENWKKAIKDRNREGTIGGKPSEVLNMSTGKIGAPPTTKGNLDVGVIQ